MKIYIITKEPFPNGMAAVKRIISYAKGWKRQGIDSEIIIYTRTERYGVKPKNTKGHGVYEGIPYKYMKDSPLRERNVLLRVFNDYYDRIRLKRYLKKNLKNGDIVYDFNRYSTTPDLITLVHSCHAKYVQELCELPFATSIENETSQQNRKKFELNIMPELDGIIAISDTLIDYAKRHCKNSCLLVKVPILVDFENYKNNNQKRNKKMVLLTSLRLLEKLRKTYHLM